MRNKLFNIVLLILITAPINIFAVGLPTINVLTVGTVTGTTAVINTQVWANGQYTSVSIQYSLLNNGFATGATTVSMGSLSAASAATNKTVTLTGLTPSKVYYFRIKTENNSGIKYSNNSSFTTTSGVTYVLAQISNVSSTVLSSTSAQIDFAIVPSNTTSVWVQYGTNPAFTTGLLTQTLATIPAGTVAVAVSTTLTSLTPATMYYYRVRTQNSVGDNYSPNSNYFNTLSTGTNSVEFNEAGFQVYPNPATDLIIFKNADEYTEKWIIDVQGKMVLKTNANEISVSHLPSGMYIVKYTNRANQVGYTKFIKLGDF